MDMINSIFDIVSPMELIFVIVGLLYIIIEMINLYYLFIFRKWTNDINFDKESPGYISYIFGIDLNSLNGFGHIPILVMLLAHTIMSVVGIAVLCILSYLPIIAIYTLLCALFLYLLLFKMRDLADWYNS